MSNKWKRRKAHHIKKEVCRRARKSKNRRDDSLELWSESWFGKRAFLYVDDPEDKSELSKKVDYIFLWDGTCEFILVEHKGRTEARFNEHWLQNITRQASEQFESMRQEENLLDDPTNTPSILLIRFEKKLPGLVKRVTQTLNSKPNHLQIDMVCLLFPNEKSWRKKAVCVVRRGDVTAIAMSYFFLNHLYFWTTGRPLPGLIFVFECVGLDIDTLRIE